MLPLLGFPSLDFSQIKKKKKRISVTPDLPTRQEKFESKSGRCQRILSRISYLGEKKKGGITVEVPKSPQDRQRYGSELGSPPVANVRHRLCRSSRRRRDSPILSSSLEEIPGSAHNPQPRAWFCAKLE